MQNDVIYESLVEVAGRLRDGEKVKITQKTAALSLWGRIIGTGFKGVTAHLRTRRRNLDREKGGP